MKRIVVAGSRDFNNYEKLKNELDIILRFFDKAAELIILSGGCQGTDALGERYAKENGIQTEIFIPEWDKYGKAAGLKRNEQMALLGDAVICFWDSKSKGTKSMIEEAKKYKKPLKIIYI